MVFSNRSEFSEAIILDLISKTVNKEIRWKSYIESVNDTSNLVLTGTLYPRNFMIQQELEQSSLVCLENVSITKSYFCRWNYNEQNDRYIRISILYLNQNDSDNLRILVVCHREHKDIIEPIADSIENNKVTELYECIKLKSCKEFNILEKLLLKNDNSEGSSLDDDDDEPQENSEGHSSESVSQ